MNGRVALAAAMAALAASAAHAQGPMSHADRAALQIRTARGNPVHMGETLAEVRVALPAAPAPQITLPNGFQTLWDQADGIVLRLSGGVVTAITYTAPSRAKIAGFDVGLDSTIAELETALGPGRPARAGTSTSWGLDDRRQLVAAVSDAGRIVSLDLLLIPKPPLPQFAPAPPKGVVNWADGRASQPAATPASAPTLVPSILPQLTGDARRARLDDLLAKGADSEWLRLVFPRFDGRPAPPRDVQAVDRAWLETHAPEGRATVLYALSWTLLPVDRDGARTMNARARVELMLAGRQCTRPVAGDPLMFMLEGEAIADVMPLRNEDPAWALAIESALAWDRGLATPVAPDWYCGADNVKPAADAAAARRDYWQRIWNTNHPKTIAAPAAH